MKVLCEKSQEVTKYGQFRDSKIVTSYYIVQIQYTGVESLLKCVMHHISFNTMCGGMSFFVINGKI